MIKQLKILTLILGVICLNSYAIEIDIKLSGHTHITALGFTVNGHSHGSLGHKYHKKHLPEGSYAFGLRVDKEDIACPTQEGHKTIQLHEDADITLHFNGKTCYMTLAHLPKIKKGWLDNFWSRFLDLFS